MFTKLWINEREQFIKNQFPTAKFKIGVYPEGLDHVVSTNKQIILIVDPCCHCETERSNDKIAILVHKKDRLHITVYDCIQAVVNIEWKPMCKHCVFSDVLEINEAGGESLVNLFKVFWAD